MADQQLQVTGENRRDPVGLAITAVTFTDTRLDTLVLREGEWAESDDRGVWVHRPRYMRDDAINFYPWTSVFSLGYTP